MTNQNPYQVNGTYRSEDGEAEIHVKTVRNDMMIADIFLYDFDQKTYIFQNTKLAHFSFFADLLNEEEEEEFMITFTPWVGPMDGA